MMLGELDENGESLAGRWEGNGLHMEKFCIKDFIEFEGSFSSFLKYIKDLGLFELVSESRFDKIYEARFRDIRLEYVERNNGPLCAMLEKINDQRRGDNDIIELVGVNVFGQAVSNFSNLVRENEWVYSGFVVG